MSKSKPNTKTNTVGNEKSSARDQRRANHLADIPYTQEQRQHYADALELPYAKSKEERAALLDVLLVEVVLIASMSDMGSEDYDKRRADFAEYCCLVFDELYPADMAKNKARITP